MSVVIASYVSRHYEWWGVGVNAFEARAVLRSVWNAQARDDWDDAQDDDVEIREIHAGQGWQDSNVVFGAEPTASGHITTLDSLIDGQDPEQDALAELLVPIRDYLKEFTG